MKAATASSSPERNVAVALLSMQRRPEWTVEAQLRSTNTCPICHVYFGICRNCPQRRHTRGIQLPTRRLLLKDDFNDLLLEHCQSAHPDEPLACLLKETDIFDNGHDKRPERVVDRVALRALRFSSTCFGSECLNASPSQRNSKFWSAEWIELTLRRIAGATAWLGMCFPSAVKDLIDDSLQDEPVKKQVLDVFEELEQLIKTHLMMLVPAVQELGIQRCINRFDLLFLHTSRYRQLHCSYRRLEPKDFLLVSEV